MLKDTGLVALAALRRPVVTYADLPMVGFNGEKFSGGYGPEPVDIDAYGDPILDYVTLRDRSCALFDTTHYGRGIIRRFVTNVVNTGLELEADPLASVLGVAEGSLDAWTDTVEDHFRLWARTPRVFDYSRTVGATLGTRAADAFREALVAGDALVILRTHPVTDLPTVQVVSGTRVGLRGTRGAPNVVHGVEVDPSTGQHRAYYVLEDGKDEATRVPAYDENGRLVAWMVYGTDKRVSQVRGVPLLGIVLQALREIDRYRDSAVRKAFVNSVLAMWIEKSQEGPSIGQFSHAAVRVREQAGGADGTGGTTRSFREIKHLPGLILEELQPGERPHSFAQHGTDVNFGEFERAVMASVAWALEIPPEILTMSFNANYSASQAALNEFVILLDMVRTRIGQEFYQPIYEDWLSASVLLGTITAKGFSEAALQPAKWATTAAWCHAAWIGAAKPVTDALKLAKAAEINVRNGWDTNARVARATTGTKFAHNAREIRRERSQLPQPEHKGNSNAK